jgi:hypothetical protein
LRGPTWKLGGGREAAGRADAGELKKRTHMAGGALHWGKKGERSDAWELLIVEGTGAGRGSRTSGARGVSGAAAQEQRHCNMWPVATRPGTVHMQSREAGADRWAGPLP